jgi:hypothetical protein
VKLYVAFTLQLSFEKFGNLAFQLRDFLDTLVFKSCTAHLTLLLYKIFLHYSMFVFSRLVLGL